MGILQELAGGAEMEQGAEDMEEGGEEMEDAEFKQASELCAELISKVQK
jgi:hypothetical protein